MSFVRPMRATDIMHFAACNLDSLTETYHNDYYLDYLQRWPEFCKVVEGADGRIEAYILGKVESSPFPPSVQPYSPSTNPDPNYLPWHAHITALTVAPHMRRMGLATRLSSELEAAGEAADAWFVDLFVRVENKVAIELYQKMGYSVYRKVVSYYADDEDAYDMRKPLKRDVGHLHVREKGEEFEVDPADVW